ncbi:hypothetical protein [Flavobacterium foetidum]|uniref:hypothetical protein n=1 Tax=Flavobacterium foetidum TaxID=2026681 RepID=UPI001075262F|nr:hypothetical protein [Flavobacterium foetidum]KAF2517885.1 hypothetical protein E0W73_01365 [Flavobacterium foetidum]
MAIEINNFLEYLNAKLDSQKVEHFTSSAFVQKRQKIKPEVFNYLSTVITDNYYVQSNENIKRFKGFRVLAVDGSKITLPYTEELKMTFWRIKKSDQHLNYSGKIFSIVRCAQSAGFRFSSGKHKNRRTRISLEA